MSKIFIVAFGTLSFFLLPWVLTNGKTDGDGLTIKESVLLVLGFIISFALSLIPKSVLEKLEQKA